MPEFWKEFVIPLSFCILSYAIGYVAGRYDRGREERRRREQEKSGAVPVDQ